MKITITRDDLIEWKACAEGLAWFEGNVGEAFTFDLHDLEAVRGKHPGSWRYTTWALNRLYTRGWIDRWAFECAMDAHKTWLHRNYLAAPCP